MKTIRLHGYIGKEDFWGDGSIVRLKDIQSEIEATSEDEVTIEINSGGGDVNEGFAIADYLRGCGKTISTEVLGLCGSIATVIALVAPIERRSMHANSDYFIHNPYWMPSGPDAMEAEDVQSLADSLKAAENKIINYYADHTTANAEDLSELMKVQSSLSAEQAKELGFIGNIIGEPIEARKMPIFAYVSKSKKSKMNFKETVLAKLNKILGQAEEIENAKQLGDFVKSKGEDVEAKLVTDMGEERFEAVINGAECPTVEEIAIIASAVETTEGEIMDMAAADGCEYTPQDAEDAESMEALKTENESLKAQIAELQSTINDLSVSLQAEKSQNEEIKSEIEEIKAMVVGGEPSPAAPVTKKVTASKYDFIRNNIAKKKSSYN